MLQTPHVLCIFISTCAFPPQRRAFFLHPSFKKCSRTTSFVTFSLPNVRFATAACNFSTAELQKVLQHRQFLSVFTSKCAFRHSGVQFLMSPLSTYLRTRRFNRCIFCLLTLALVHLFTFDLTACRICFSTLHIVGSLLFKLPSIIQ